MASFILSYRVWKNFFSGIFNREILILEENQREENFQNVFKCPVIDGINIGNIEKPKKGLSEEIFKEQKVKNKTVCGVEAADRTAI